MKNAAYNASEHLTAPISEIVKSHEPQFDEALDSIKDSARGGLSTLRSTFRRFGWPSLAAGFGAALLVGYLIKRRAE